MSRILSLIGTFMLFGAVPLPAADASDWEELVARKKQLSAMKPTRAEGEEFDLFVKLFSNKAGELADAFKAFYNQDPKSKEGREAWRQWMNHLDLAAQRIPERKAELEETEKRFLDDPNLSKAFRESIRWNQVDRIYDLSERERFVRSVNDEFSGNSFLSHHLLNIAQFADTDHARALMEEVLKLPHSEHDRAHWEGKAMELKAKLDRIGKPIELQFTALDGAHIDLKDYEGKVVLIDFWATWCGPCIAGLPEVRELWNKHRHEGFEVICISYDTNRKVLDDFVKKNAIPWPQFFSEEGKDAPLTTGFGKPGPPAYWLVDRSGNLAEISGWDNLEGTVKRLLSKDRKNAE